MTRTIAAILAVALAGCEDPTYLDQRCPCLPEIDDTLAVCTEQDQEVKSELERQLFDLRDSYEATLADHEARIRALEGAP